MVHVLQLKIDKGCLCITEERVETQIPEKSLRPRFVLMKYMRLKIGILLLLILEYNSSYLLFVTYPRAIHLESHFLIKLKLNRANRVENYPKYRSI